MFTVLRNILFPFATDIPWNHITEQNCMNIQKNNIQANYCIIFYFPFYFPFISGNLFLENKIFKINVKIRLILLEKCTHEHVKIEWPYWSANIHRKVSTSGSNDCIIDYSHVKFKRPLWSNRFWHSLRMITLKHGITGKQMTLETRHYWWGFG
jgi:hypothetical protein